MLDSSRMVVALAGTAAEGVPAEGDGPLLRYFATAAARRPRRSGATACAGRRRRTVLRDRSAVGVAAGSRPLLAGRDFLIE